MNLPGTLSLSALLHGTALVAVVLAPGVIGLEGASVEEPRPFVRMETAPEFRPTVEFFEVPPPAVETALAPEGPAAAEPAVEEEVAATAPTPPARQIRPRPATELAPVVTGGDAPSDSAPPTEAVVEARPAEPPAEPYIDAPDRPEPGSADALELPAEETLALAPAAEPAREPRGERANPARETRDAAEPVVPAAPPAPTVDIDALYATYAATLERLIQRHKSYPRVAQRAGLQGTVVVEVRIDDEGRIVAVRVLRSSGHGVLDRAAVASIERIGRFNAPPREVPWGDRPIEIPLQYTL